MNYVFSDGEGTADNNSGSDYATPISGDMTPERWLEEAPLRVVSRGSGFRQCAVHDGGSARMSVAKSFRRDTHSSRKQRCEGNCWGVGCRQKSGFHVDLHHNGRF